MTSQQREPLQRGGREIVLRPRVRSQLFLTIGSVFLVAAAILTVVAQLGGRGASFVWTVVFIGMGLLTAVGAASGWYQRAVFAGDQLRIRVVRGEWRLALPRLARIRLAGGGRFTVLILQDELSASGRLVNYPWDRVWALLAPYCSGRQINFQDPVSRAGIVRACEEQGLAPPAASDERG
jgi:hypothetical protein